jgi:hypothetical protein
MPSLYSYCILYDDGAVPNPYWDVCTLVICKSAIRRTAKEGDWIVGTGSKHCPPTSRHAGGVPLAGQRTTRSMPRISDVAVEGHPREPAW